LSVTPFHKDIQNRGTELYFKHINVSVIGLPKIKGGSVPVTERELAALTYKPKSSDWPSAGLDIECDRISQDLDKVMELSIAEHFLAPVDLNAFPIYGMIIAYPIDLSLIKSRLEKRFYR